MKYYGNSSEKVEKLLHSDSRTGLDEREAKKRLSRLGKNEIFLTEEAHPWKVALKLIYDPMSILLLLVSLICFSAFSLSYALLVLTVWAVNLTITIFSYNKAEKIFHSLKNYGIPKMKVLRDSKIYMVDSRLLVPGDIVIIEAGDIICADCKLISSSELYVYEKDVCGTDVAVRKYVSDDVQAIKLSDMHGMLFASSSVISGHGVAIVAACADQTEIVGSAGLIPISQKQYPELFSQVKRKCRVWSLLTIFVAFVIFTVKMFTHPTGIFDAFVLIIALIGASMSESLLPLTQIAAARGMVNAAQIGDKNRVIIKNSGSLEQLNSITVFLATDEITEFENMNLLSKLKEKGISVLLLAKEQSAFQIATKYGAPVFRDARDIKLRSLSLGVYVSKNVDDALCLLNNLKDSGEVIGALTTKLDYIRMLSDADVGFTYGKFKYKTEKYSKIHLENISGGQNQILCRVSDVICEENMMSTYRAVGCAKGIYSAVSNAAAYLITMQTTRVILCILELFFGFSCITFTQILFGGMVFDLLALFCFAFLSEKAYVKDKRRGIIDYSISCSDAFILSISVLICSMLPYGIEALAENYHSSTVAFFIMSAFPVIYLWFITQNRKNNGSGVIICLLMTVVFSVLILCGSFSAVSSVLSIKIGSYDWIFIFLGIFMIYGLLILRRYVFNNKLR